MKKLFLIIAFIFVGCISGQNIRIDQIRELPDTIAYLRNLHAMGDTNTVQAFIRDSLGRFWDSTEVKDAIGDSTAVIRSQWLDSTNAKSLIHDTADVLRGEMSSSGGIDYNVSITDFYSTPEQYEIYSAVQLNQIKMAIDSAAGRPILFRGTYTIADSLKKDLSDGKLDLIFAQGSSITSTTVRSAGTEHAPSGDIIFTNGSKLTITGGTIIGNSSGQTYQSTVYINDIDEVTLQDVNIKKGKWAGVNIVNVDKLTLNNVTCDSNGYAGALIHSVEQGNVYGGNYSYNGTTAYSNGYGISFSGRFGTNADNKNITIDGIKANYNLRNGIDIHGGINVSITNNKIKGWTNNAIGAVNEPGTGGVSVNYEKLVRNLVISKNILTQDSTWKKSLGLGVAKYASAIQVGNYIEGTPLGEYGGSILIEGNILDSMAVAGTDTSRALIYCFINSVGSQLEAVNILNNTILNSTVTSYEFSTFQDGVIFLTDGSVPPKLINISNNNFYGTGTNGIKVLCYNTSKYNSLADSFSTVTNINNNNIFGTFSNPVYVHPSLKQLTSNNSYNGKRLADMDDGYNGIRKFGLYTSAYASRDSLILIDTVDTYFAGVDGFVNYNIKITSSNDVHFGTYIYNFLATAKNVSTTPTFTVTQMSEGGVDGTSTTARSDYRPTVAWRTNGNKGKLVMLDNDSNGFTKYNVEMVITSRNIPYWRTE